MIAIVNYGLGNIRAFTNIYKSLGVPITIATCSAELARATRLILPGVGAFDHAMECLEGSGMQGLLCELVLERRLPVLGVCVGMQILANSSEEGSRPGLGWIEGVVRKIRFPVASNQDILPHMGWNTVRLAAPSPLFENLDAEHLFYFLHSYYFECAHRDDSVASADYGDSFTCAVHSGNIYGVQFHPEKSHRNGIQLLNNFADL